MDQPKEFPWSQQTYENSLDATNNRRPRHKIASGASKPMRQPPPTLGPGSSYATFCMQHAAIKRFYETRWANFCTFWDALPMDTRRWFLLTSNPHLHHSRKNIRSWAGEPMPGPARFAPEINLEDLTKNSDQPGSLCGWFKYIAELPMDQVNFHCFYVLGVEFFPHIEPAKGRSRKFYVCGSDQWYTVNPGKKLELTGALKEMAIDGDLAGDAFMRIYMFFILVICAADEYQTECLDTDSKRPMRTLTACFGGCGATTQPNGKPLQQCAKCQLAWYCGRECQKKDWPEHKVECQPKP